MMLNKTLKACFWVAALTMSSQAWAQEKAAFEPFDGVITTDKVNIRCGASKSNYVVTQLNRGDKIRVQDIMPYGGWYKILPPAGTYSLISKDFVELNPDGKTGRVTRNQVHVRAPNPTGPEDSYRIQLRLNTDDKITLANQAQSDAGFYRIVPPKGAYLYVTDAYVGKASEVVITPPPVPTPPTATNTDTATTNTSATDTTATDTTTTDPTTTDATTTDTTATDTTTGGVQSTDTTPPAKTVSVTVLKEGKFQLGDNATLLDIDQLKVELAKLIGAEANTQLTIRATEDTKYQQIKPLMDAAKTAGFTKLQIQKIDPNATATQNTGTNTAATDTGSDTTAKDDSPKAQAEKALTELEQEYALASAKPIEEQPIEELILKYTQMKTDTRLGAGAQSLVKTRLELLNTLKQVQALRKELARQKQLRWEQEQNKPAPNYSAVGKLQASALYTGEKLPLMYRLVDPLNQRAIAYVKPIEGQNMASLTGHFVGIIGPIHYDEGMRLRIITPSQIDPLNIDQPNPNRVKSPAPAPVPTPAPVATPTPPAATPATDTAPPAESNGP